VEGLYRLSGDDILGCTDFGDAIGVNAWPMELHVEGKVEWRFFPDNSRGYCQLPVRMLVPRSVSNLLVAGRCASMTHEGQSAARASGACFRNGPGGRGRSRCGRTPACSISTSPPCSRT
jgi:hypothetical protein